VLDCARPDLAALAFGTTAAAGGRASLAFADTAIKCALAGEIDAVVAAPQNETTIARAGIKFDGYPSFVARATGTDENDVYLMLCFGDIKIVHATLHRSVRDAVAMITRERVIGAIGAAERALRLMGTPTPKIAVGGLNPHAGEGGLFGREEIDIIKPAVDAAVARGIAATGPFGADTMFRIRGVDAFVVMLHDQGHIAAKLLAPDTTAAVTIGSPILFSSVAHGSAHDSAGKGVANPKAMIEALLRLSGVKQRVEQHVPLPVSP
jgi:4-hydroxy-L-threonine phosphate dehydrogenase PdxA